MTTILSSFPASAAFALAMAVSPMALAGDTRSIFEPADPTGRPGVQDSRSALSIQDLQAMTGMGADALESAIISTNSLVNTAGDVHAGDLMSGDISFSGSALQNATGMTNFVVNTGHGASVQGGLSVNIILK